jgi:alpha-maltose-1-phosphate synthase
MKPLVGVVGSRLIGSQPFDPRCWSGSSYQFFSELQRRKVLQNAFGVEVSRWKQWELMLRSFSMHREVWRRHFYMGTSYRNALTREIRAHLSPEDAGCDYLQIGSMFDVPSLLNDQFCYSYHDGNLAQSLRAPNVPKGLNPRRVAEGLEYERRVCKGMRLVFSEAEYLRRSFIEDYEIAPDRVVTIGAGVNLAQFPEENPSKRYDNAEVLFIGVDFARKGGWQLLQAFQRVRERIPNARLHVVGPRELSIPHESSLGVEYHGFLSKTDSDHFRKLEQLFLRSSVFVMPSLYEPFGIAPLEAMAYQLPCILTRGWALQEFVVPGRNGFLVEAGQADSLEAALLEALRDPDRLQVMGKNARLFVLENYTWPRVIDRLINALGNVSRGNSK